MIDGPDKTLRWTRRQALARMAGTAMTLGLGSPTSRLSGAAAGRWFKIGVCDWNLGKAGDPEAMRVAAELALDGVMVSFGAPGAQFDLREAEHRERYTRAVKEHGTVVSSLGMAVLNGVPYKSDPRTEQWVSDSINVAKALGTSIVLLAFFGKGDLREDRAGTEEVIRRLRRVAPLAEKAGIVLGLETWLDAAGHMRIVDGVASPNVKVYYDLGNSLHRGYDIYEEIRQLGGQHICEFHAKDYAGKLFGHGDVDFWEVRRAIDDIHYSGWIVIEGRTPFGLMRSYRHDQLFLRSLFPPRG